MDAAARKQVDGGISAESPANTAAAIALPDLLAYLADMTRELHQMADPTPCRTLAGLLGLAHSEALLRREEAIRSAHTGD